MKLWHQCNIVHNKLLSLNQTDYRKYLFFQILQGNYIRVVDCRIKSRKLGQFLFTLTQYACIVLQMYYGGEIQSRTKTPK